MQKVIFCAVCLQNIFQSYFYTFVKVERPKDVGLRVRLLQLYLDSGRIADAYEHATDVEKCQPYPESHEWYQCLAKVHQVCLLSPRCELDQLSGRWFL